MPEFFPVLLDVTVVVFPVTSMLAVGLAYSLREIIGPLRDLGAVARALAANFVLVPALAWVVGRMLSLDAAYLVGLALLGVAAGAPFLIKLTEAAESDVGLSATLLVLLLPATVVVMPLTVPLIAPEARVDPAAIATPLVLSMLLPLVAGLVIRRRWPEPAGRLQQWLGVASTASLVGLIVATVVVNLATILDIFGQRAIPAAIVFILGAFAIGYVLGGSDPDAREVLGLGTGQRNIAAATVVSAQSVGDPDTLVMVIVVGVMGQVLLFPIAGVLRRKERARHAAV